MADDYNLQAKRNYIDSVIDNIDPYQTQVRRRGFEDWLEYATEQALHEQDWLEKRLEAVNDAVAALKKMKKERLEVGDAE